MKITTGEEMFAAGRIAAPKILLFGPSGSGKTTLLASVDPEGTGKALFVALEPQGIEVAVGVNPRLHIYDVHGEAKRSKISRYQLLQELLMQMMGGDFPYRVVCFDGLTEIARAILEAFTTKTETDWLGYTKAMTRFMVCLRDLQGITIVCSCLTKTQFDEDHVYRFIPDIEGKKLPPQVPSFFNAVGFPFRRENAEGQMEYLILFEGPERYSAKPMKGLGRVEVSDLRLILAKIYAVFPGDPSDHAPWDLRPEDVEQPEQDALPATHEQAQMADKVRQLRTQEAIDKREKKAARAKGENPGGLAI